MSERAFGEVLLSRALSKLATNFYLIEKNGEKNDFFVWNSFF